MMENKGFLRIKETIIGEAEAEAKRIRDEAEKEAVAFEEEKQKEASSFSMRELEKIGTEKQQLQDKMLAQARLSAQKQYLMAREALIDELVEKAMTSIKRDASYNTFMKKLLSTHITSLKQPVTLLVNKEDVKLAKSMMTSLKIKGVVSEVSIRGGMTIEDAEGKRIQETLEARLERIKDEIRMKIAKMIGEGTQ